MYIDPCTVSLNATYLFFTILYRPNKHSTRRVKEKYGETKRTEESLPRQIGTGSSCGNCYKRIA